MAANVRTRFEQSTHSKRAETMGMLSVGPISLGRALTDSAQAITVTFRTLNRDGSRRAPITLMWTFHDQEEDRYWILFTRQFDFMARYQYKVRTIITGSLFSGGTEWEDQDWRDASGSGPLIIAFPKPESSQVVRHNRLSAGRATLSRSPVPLPPMVIELDDATLRQYRTES